MLYIVATPIGNLADISARALEVLRGVDVIAAEDTRRTRQLLTHFEIGAAGRLISYREQTEGRAGARILAHLDEGRDVALVTDGGMPGISDPGYRLVAAAADRDLPFEVIPGPSAVTAALLASGLPTSSFTFKGFAPRKASARKHFFEDDAAAPHTLIVFESPYRIAATLRAAHEVLGDRRAAVVLELTKKFERVERGYLGDLSDRFMERSTKGEVTLVIAGNHPKFMRNSGPAADETSVKCRVSG